MFTEKQKHFIDLVESRFGKEYIISRKQILDLQEENGIGYPNWLTTDDQYKIGRGMFKVPTLSTISSASIENIVPMKKHTNNFSVTESLIPEKDPNFEKFGFYNELKSIIKSKKFFPVFISGHSGIGKTFLVEQVCAELKRECIRVNFSIETDKTDLIGSQTLIDGNIVFNEGPVLKAMREGAVLLLDEQDRANGNTCLILNSIMEGKQFYNTYTKELIKAKEGFNVIATANTKGMGSDDGKYLSQILDSAFLERFYVTFEQPFPTEKLENKILQHHLQDFEFADKLVKWASVIRKTFQNGGIDEIISTRRLVHIAETYNIFNNKLKAVELCCSRYETHVKESFVDLYTKIDANVQFDDSGNAIDESNEKSNVPDHL